MSRKRKTYSADFKAKLVLELLEANKMLLEVAQMVGIKNYLKVVLTNGDSLITTPISERTAPTTSMDLWSLYLLPFITFPSTLKCFPVVST